MISYGERIKGLDLAKMEVSQGNLSAVFTKIKDILEDIKDWEAPADRPIWERFLNDNAHQSGIYISIENERQRGKIAGEDYKISKNTVSDAMLELIGSIKKTLTEKVDQSVQAGKKPTIADLAIWAKESRHPVSDFYSELLGERLKTEQVAKEKEASAIKLHAMEEEMAILEAKNDQLSKELTREKGKAQKRVRGILGLLRKPFLLLIWALGASLVALGLLAYEFNKSEPPATESSETDRYKRALKKYQDLRTSDSLKIDSISKQIRIVEIAVPTPSGGSGVSPGGASGTPLPKPYVPVLYYSYNNNNDSGDEDDAIDVDNEMNPQIHSCVRKITGLETINKEDYNITIQSFASDYVNVVVIHNNRQHLRTGNVAINKIMETLQTHQIPCLH